MHQSISKFYSICELFNDNLFSVEEAIIKAKYVMNKKRVYGDLENLRVAKYEAHFDIILAKPELFTRKYNLIVLER